MPYGACSYSICWMPAAPITLVHFAVSLFKNVSNSSGVPAISSAPSADRRAVMSGDRSAFTISAFSFLMMPDGVLAGASTPNDDENSYPGRPNFAIVGASGARARPLGARDR